jgi:putative Flp pilus-assembly TadE/G-like protein
MRPIVIATAPPAQPPSAPARPPLTRAPARQAPSRGPRAGLGLAPASHPDRGSISVLVIFFALIALALASLLVDVGNALNARERAADIAEQAARAGANDVDVAALRTGLVQIDTATACGRAANLVAAYGASSGFNATARCASVSPQQITITVSVTTKPLIAASLGNFTVHASATAEPVCGVTRAGQC